LPGGALVASVTDGLSGAPLSSMAKGLQAAISATATAVGVLATLTVVARLGISSETLSTPTPPWLMAAASGLAVAALAVARSMPLDLVLPTAALAVAGWLTSHAIPDVGSGLSAGVFVAAVVIGLGAQVLARLRRTSATVHTSVAVFVLVPGVVFYRSMLAFSQGDSTTGVDLLINALGASGSIAAGIALGVAIGRSVPAPRPAVRVWQRTRTARPVVLRAGRIRPR
ncbi:MAG: threonine/serine exporter family protein, partial [Microthrixaceae bacterium]